MSSAGGLPLKWFVHDSCKEFPFDPPTAYKDFAPDSGLYTLAADEADACPNIAGAQSTVPAYAHRVRAQVAAGLAPADALSFAERLEAER